MIIDHHIFFISASDNLRPSHVVLQGLSLVLFHFWYAILFSNVIAFHDLTHPAWIETWTFIFDAFVDFLCECGQSCGVEFHMMFLNMLVSEVVLFLKGSFLANSL